MLERIAADLVRASESLAREESAMGGRHRGQSVYIPVIVTNATLYACRIAPGDVDLTSGTVPTSARFEEVGAVRFRKALPSEVQHDPGTYTSLSEGMKKKERSAVVVNVAHLSKWLAAVRERPRSPLDFSGHPWAHLDT
jgi:hypothetical protein